MEREFLRMAKRCADEQSGGTSETVRLALAGAGSASAISDEQLDLLLPTVGFEVIAPTEVSAGSKFIDKLALVLVRERKQLVARSRGKSAFFTPGGKREAGESDVQALCRECKEELTVDLKVDTIRPYGIFQAQAHGKPEGTLVRMVCYVADYEGTLAPSEEVEELRWITSNCPHSDLSVTGVMILKDLKARDLID